MLLFGAGREGRIVPFVVVEWVGRAILDWEVPPKPECKNMTKTIREFHYPSLVFTLDLLAFSLVSSGLLLTTMKLLLIDQSGRIMGIYA